MKKALIIFVAIAVIAIALYSQRMTIATAVVKAGLEAQMSADRIAELEDGLHLALCGAGGPLPAPDASGPCVAIIAGERLFVVDAGTDGLRNLLRMGLQPGNIEALFLTHFHSDHIDGLGEMATIRWVGVGNTAPLPVYGPTGVQQVVDGFNLAYAQDAVYRYDHHGDTVAPLSGAGMVARAIEKPAIGELATLYEEDDLTIQMLTVDHSPVEPAVGYLFKYKDRSLLISGDTVAMENVRQFAQGVDLLVHEALAPNLVGLMNETATLVGNEVLAKVTHDILDYHAYPVQVAEMAREADVGHLLYYHIVPPIVVPGQESLFLNGAEEVFPYYTVGKDGVFFSMPEGTAEIILTSEGL
jgi:ribonuclease Z